MDVTKNTIVKIPRFIIPNESNLSKYKICNIDDSIDKLYKEFRRIYVYKPRSEVFNDLYPANSMSNILPMKKDKIVGIIVGIDKVNDVFNIKIIDTLYYSKLNNPCIKVNGIGKINDSEQTIHITSILRVTMDESGQLL